MLKLLAEVVGGLELAPLFRKENRKLALFILVSISVQVAYWYLGTPGPQLLRGAEQGLALALGGVGWAVVFLLFVPLVTARFLALPLDHLFRLGDVTFGLRATLILGLIATASLFFGAASTDLHATYPWPGTWLAERWHNVLLWPFLYGLYYVSFEFFYRGFLLRGLTSFWGLNAAIWTQVLASVLIHVGKPWVETVAAIPAGLLFAGLALRSRSLLYPILLHLFIGLATDLFSLYHQGLL